MSWVTSGAGEERDYSWPRRRLWADQKNRDEKRVMTERHSGRDIDPVE